MNAKKMLNSTGLTRRFARNEDGATALTFALGLTVMLMGVGMGVDYAAASKAQFKAQNIADASALAAAAFKRENPEVTPETDEDGFRDGVWYTSDKAGWQFDGFVVDGAKGVELMVDYRDTHAIAHVKGKTRPALMSLFGYEEIEFTAQTRVEYARDRGGDPASVFLILDNSGSMNWDDGTGTKRLDGLKTSVNQFMNQLTQITDAIPAGGQRPLRTGMIPFTGVCEPYGDICDTVEFEGIVRGDVVQEDFGTIDEDDINSMIPRWATDPVDALEEAAVWMADEEQVHLNELLQKSPDNYDPDEFKVLRYVILMSDGANSMSRQTCEEFMLPSNYNWTGWDGDGRKYQVQERYRLRQYESRGGSTEYRNYNNAIAAEHNRRYRRWYNDGSMGSWTTWIDWNNRIRDGRTGRDHTSAVPPSPDISAGHRTNTINSQRSSQPYYVCQWQSYDSINTEMRNMCQRLKDDGVEVYTIGYGLTAQEYDTNWADEPKEDISESAAATALANLRLCATDPETHFMEATDAQRLNQVFQEIGQNIVDESIRLSK